MLMQCPGSAGVRALLPPRLSSPAQEMMAMEHMSAAGTWKYEDFAEYVEHSLTHDDVPDEVVSAAAGGVVSCESRQERDDLPCPAEAQWKIRVGTREADAQLSCGRHLHRSCQIMYIAEDPRRPVLTLTALW